MKAVIFAGGVGTRLWPMSREGFPKQFQLLIGKHSIFRQTVDRVFKGFEPEDVFVSTGNEYAKYVIAQAPEIPQRNIILEPERRDSMGAVGYATAYIHHYYPDSVMTAIWGADHLVEDGETFITALKAAGKVAQEEHVICKVDSRPIFPSTDNGWVEIGKMRKKVDGFDVFEFIRFVEKPNAETAKKLFRSYRFLINVGYMAWRTSVMLGFYEKYQPSVYVRLKRIEAAIDTSEEQEILAKEYPQVEKNSVDYGIFEKLQSKDMVVIPADMGWTDIGTWDLLYTGLAKKEGENVIQADVHELDSKGNLVWGNGKRMIGMVGIEDLVIVDAPDALLVCRRGRTGEVKELLKKLKESKKDPVL